MDPDDIVAVFRVDGHEDQVCHEEPPETSGVFRVDGHEDQVRQEEQPETSGVFRVVDGHEDQVRHEEPPATSGVFRFDSHEDQVRQEERPETSGVFRVDSYEYQVRQEERPETSGTQAGNNKMMRKVSNDETDRDLAEEEDDLVSIPNDVYNMFFLANVGGQGFYYAAYIMVLKMTLYTLLALDAIGEPLPDEVETRILAAQFLMLPVAVAMQEDLISTYFLIANIKFCPSILKDNPGASYMKFNAANLCRGIDGVYSLVVNFIILMKAESVLSLFLNFAALQFLQRVDNSALDLAADGYLTNALEEAASCVVAAKLPRKNTKWLLVMDSFLFVATTVILIGAWAYITYGRI
jgi:hypothetical protein